MQFIIFHVFKLYNQNFKYLIKGLSMKISKYRRIFLFNSMYIILFISFSEAFARKKQNMETTTFKFSQNDKYIIIESYTDDIIHIESGINNQNEIKIPLYTTPMIANPKAFKGAEKFLKSDNKIETNNLSMTVSSDLCIQFYNKKLAYSLAKICAENLNQQTKNLKIFSDQNKNAYGLGQYFYDPNTANGDWIGRKWEPGEFGNSFSGFSGGANSKIQFPILYALGDQKQNFAVFIDSQYKMGWDFTNKESWNVSLWGEQIRYFIIAGNNLEELRQKYLSLTGTPTVPPKKMLGLWVSEYGYHNWDEINYKLSHMRAHKFPVDGFALDLYWFGGTQGMGTVAFDPKNFPNAAQNINQFKAQGVEFIPIQESYVAESALAPNATKTDYEDLSTRCFFVRQNNKNCIPSYFKNTWWGSGGMIDWTNDNAADYWFEKKEIPLIKLGINQFWLDLNEPEMYDANAYYSGIMMNGILKNRHADVANLYAFKWIESLYRGYQSSEFQNRPIFMSRAGAPGIQRFGAGMWSGDIGANLGGLKAHINNQMNVSLSGIDFYSADTGGFHRNVFDGNNIQKLYTMWFANAAVFDFPVRPHTWVGETENSETTPSLIGDFSANKENIIQRYVLSPYYYSLFYRAHLYGEAVIPPLVSVFQNDDEARKNSSEKMIGKYLLGSTVYQYSDPIRKNIYLPEGNWLNFHTLDEVTKSGKKYIDFPTYINNKFKIPLFIREGAIIPQMFVDENTLNISGLRKDGSNKNSNELILKIFPSTNETNFTLYEDDGETIEYKTSFFSQTVISQKRSGNLINVNISPTKGMYKGNTTVRNIRIEIALPNDMVTAVNMDSLKVLPCSETIQSNCWQEKSRNSYEINLQNVNKRKNTEFIFTVIQKQNNYSQYNFTCLNGQTSIGESIYIVGNIPELGNWDIKKAIKLNPVEYPTWTQYITNIPANSKNIEWKCIKKSDVLNNVLQWQNGTNNRFSSKAGGYEGNLNASF